MTRLLCSFLILTGSAAHAQDPTTLLPIGGSFAWGIIDREGNVVIEPSITDLYAPVFSEGLAAVQERIDGPYVYIDLTGAQAIATEFAYAGPFREGLARVAITYDDPELEWIPRRWGFIDASGHFIIEPVYHDASDFHEGLAAVLDENGTWGYIDRDGEIVIPFRYSWAQEFSGGLAAVQDGSSLWGYIDRDGNVAIPLQLRGWVGPFSDGMARISQDNKCGYIDRSGEIIVQPRYAICSGFSAGVGRVYEDTATGRMARFLDKEGNLLDPPHPTPELRDDRWVLVGPDGHLVETPFSASPNSYVRDHVAHLTQIGDDLYMVSAHSQFGDSTFIIAYLDGNGHIIWQREE